MTVRDDLLAAYALVQDEARWCRGEYQNNGRCCATGAINLVLGFSPTPNPGPSQPDAIKAADDSALDLFPDAVNLESVNDGYGHRAATMVLRHAILREEGLA